MSPARSILGWTAIGALLVIGPAACATSSPLGRPVPTGESVAVRGELAAVLLRSGRYDEAAREYWRLVQLDGGSADYRLGLARALAWGGHYGDAEHHLRVLAALRPVDPVVDSLLRSVRANMTPGVREAQSWVAERPTHTPYRIALARALVAEGRLEDALAQNDIILATTRGPEVLVDRARIHILRDDFSAAEADLRRSIAIRPTAGAWLALGDLHRWRGAFDEARVAYESARWLGPEDRAVDAAFAQLARDERPPPVATSVPGQEPGWGLSFGAVHDNAGIDYIRLGARRGFAPGGGFTGSVGAEYRDLREATSSETIASSGVAADVALARSGVRGALFGAVGVSAGAVYHAGHAVMGTAGVALRGGYRTWVVALDLATGPAYPTLLTGASLAPSDRGADPLRERGITFSAGGPVGPADAALTWQRADISDGNRRSALTVSARYPLTQRLSALYAGNGIAYAARSPLYWDPDGYVANAFGLEYADREVRGFSYAGRGRVGVAWSEESPFLRAPVEPGGGGTFLQLDLGADLAYRGEGWEVAASYGFGRVSGYQRNEALVTVRIVP